jgi:hypothetical protein
MFGCSGDIEPLEAGGSEGLGDMRNPAAKYGRCRAQVKGEPPNASARRACTAQGQVSVGKGAVRMAARVGWLQPWLGMGVPGTIASNDSCVPAPSLSHQSTVRI